MRIDSDNVFHDTYFCPSYDVDRFYKANLGFFLRIVQDVAANHSWMRGCSIPHLMEEGRTWVILRSVLEIRRYPSWPSRVRVRTWPMPYAGRRAPRGTAMADVKGRLVALCLSDWCILDLATRRPVAPGFIEERLPNVLPGPGRAVPERPPRTPRCDDIPPEGWESVRPVVPQRHDSDYNGHINNIPYVNWMLNALDALVPDDHLVSRIDVSWLKETFLEDRLEARAAKDREREGVYHTQVARGDEVVCVAEIEMKDRSSFPG